MEKLITLLIGLVLSVSCIERINIDTGDSYDSQLVVDGLITDEPGPYTVKLSLSSRIDGFLQFRKLISAKRVIIFDSEGNSEELVLVEAGTYQTKQDGLRGVVGREYFVRIETLDGKVYESIPDKMKPVGQVDSIYYRLENFQPVDAPTRYGFRVFVDAQGIPNEENLYRWKFVGTYKITTSPLLHKRNSQECTLDPRPCGEDGPFGECTCCICWVNQYDLRPIVSDNQFISDGEFRSVEVAYIPISYIPFQLKYRIEVKQMSLSRIAFDYWKIIQTQKEGGSSLFQPPTGQTRTNIYEKNGLGKPQGIFYAAAVSVKRVYVSNKEVDHLFLKIPKLHFCSGPGEIDEDCRLAFPHSTTIEPVDWK